MTETDNSPTKQTKIDQDYVGTLVAGRYEVKKKIASGGMATVYLAKDKHLDRELAIKIIHSHLVDDSEKGAEFVTKFKKEARAAAKLHHPGIVTIYDHGIDETNNNINYLTMEYVDGITLRKRLRNVGSFSIGDALKNIENILISLSVAHKSGLVHRDIKPENILIDQSASSLGTLKLTDFGLARINNEMSVAAMTDTVFGTVAYLAPEIIKNGQSDARADCYAVGIILYELIAGTQPYAGLEPIATAMKHVHENIPNLSEIYPQIPTQVSKFIEILCNRDKDKRPADATKALALLNRVVSSLTVHDLSVKIDPPKKSKESDDHNTNNPDKVLPAFAPTITGGQSYSSNGYSTGQNLSLTTNENKLNNTGAKTNVLTKTQIIPNKKGVKNDPNSGYIASVASQKTAYSTWTFITKGKKNGWKSAVIKLLIVLAIIALCIGSVIWMLDYGPGAKTPVPSSIVGSDLKTGQKILDDAGFHYKITEDFSDTIEKGVVISTDPKSGTVLSKRADTVQLVISKGVHFITIPKDLVGQNSNDVKNTIDSLGFDSPVHVKNEYSTTVKKGLVISVSPTEGSTQKHDTKVTLLVSKGPAPVQIDNYLNKNAATVMANLTKAGLNCQKTEQYSDTVEIGSIISQSIPQGQKTHQGDTIEFVISKGSELVVVPNVVGMSESQASVALEKAGLKYSKSGESILNKVQKQSVTAGQKAKRGSVIALTIV